MLVLIYLQKNKEYSSFLNHCWTDDMENKDELQFELSQIYELITLNAQQQLLEIAHQLQNSNHDLPLTKYTRVHSCIHKLN